MTAPVPHNTASYQPERAPRGAALSCLGWPQEAVLRMLLNSLDPEVAEKPQELLIAGIAGRAARDWESLHSIAASLRSLKNDESLLVESGRPGGVFPSAPTIPRVLVTGTGNQPAGDWLYAGSQTALPVTYELFGAIARRHFGGTLAGRLVVSSGLGGAGGAQSLAATLHGAAFLGLDADVERIKRRVKTGYCDALVNDLDEALRILKNAVRRGAPASVGLIANCAEMIPQLARRGVVPDLLTDATPGAEPSSGYIPQSLTPEAAEALSRKDPETFRRQALDSIAAHRRGMAELRKLGSLVIADPSAAGSDFSGASEYLAQLYLERRLVIWMALSGETADIVRADRLALEIFSGDSLLQEYLPLAGKYVRFQGLPARAALIREHDLARFGLALNDLVAKGQLAAPFLIGSQVLSHDADQLGGDQPVKTVAVPVPPSRLFEMLPGSACGAIWALLRTSNDPAKPPRLVAKALVADGTLEAAERIAAILDT